jgi:hypothetical protein
MTKYFLHGKLMKNKDIEMNLQVFCLMLLDLFPKQKVVNFM